jgi:hypothetical protein
MNDTGAANVASVTNLANLAGGKKKMAAAKAAAMGTSTRNDVRAACRGVACHTIFIANALSR